MTDSSAKHSFSSSIDPESVQGQDQKVELGLKEALQGDAPFILAALYKFVTLDNYEDLKPLILDEMHRLEIKGSLLLATEGINGTVSGAREPLDQFLAFLKQDQRLSDLTHKESYALEEPFHRAKVNLKREIVTMGVPGVDPNRVVGTYVTAKEWNDLISKPDTLLIDTRNDYEYRIGTFQGAVNPKTTSFREFPQWLEDRRDELSAKPRIAMFCTGGIRCEKATSYLKDRGFDEVYHLQGGILKYLEEVDENDSLWDGECFVFDERVSVRHKLAPGEYDLCHGCRVPITEDDKQSIYYEPGVCCPHCFHELTEDRKSRFRERQKQIKLAEQRNERHIGRAMPYQTRRHSNQSKP